VPVGLVRGRTPVAVTVAVACHSVSSAALCFQTRARCSVGADPVTWSRTSSTSPVVWVRPPTVRKPGELSDRLAPGHALERHGDRRTWPSQSGSMRGAGLRQLNPASAIGHAVGRGGGGLAPGWVVVTHSPSSSVTSSEVTYDPEAE